MLNFLFGAQQNFFLLLNLFNLLLNLFNRFNLLLCFDFKRHKIWLFTIIPDSRLLHFKKILATVIFIDYLLPLLVKHVLHLVITHLSAPHVCHRVSFRLRIYATTFNPTLHNLFFRLDMQIGRFLNLDMLIYYTLLLIN